MELSAEQEQTVVDKIFSGAGPSTSSPWPRKSA